MTNIHPISTGMYNFNCSKFSFVPFLHSISMWRETLLKNNFWKYAGRRRLLHWKKGNLTKQNTEKGENFRFSGRNWRRKISNISGSTGTKQNISVPNFFNKLWKKLLTGIPRASGLTGTLKGSAASIFITFLIICAEQTECIIIIDNVMLGNSKQNQEGQLYQSSN